MTAGTATEPSLINLWWEGRLAWRWAHDKAPAIAEDERLSLSLPKAAPGQLGRLLPRYRPQRFFAIHVGAGRLDTSDVVAIADHGPERLDLGQIPMELRRWSVPRTVSIDATDRAWEQLHTLEHLTADTRGFGDDGLLALGSAASLRHLEIEDFGFHPSTIAAAGLGRLQTLMIFGKSEPVGDLSFLAATPEVEQLQLHLLRITDAAIPGLDACPRLEWLSLSANPLTGRGLDALACRDNLRHLSLAGTRVGRSAIATLAAFPLLDSLDLSATSFGDEDTPSLRPLQELHRLRIDSTPLTDAGFRSLAADAPRLQSLNLMRTLVTPAGLEALNELPELRALYVSGSLITHHFKDILTDLPNVHYLAVTGDVEDPDVLIGIMDLVGSFEFL